MGTYRVLIKRSVERDLRRLEASHRQRIIRVLRGLAENPYPPGRRKLVGTEKLYRVRVGEYRVVYEVNKKKKIVIIYYIRHRREAYTR